MKFIFVGGAALLIGFVAGRLTVSKPTQETSQSLRGSRVAPDPKPLPTKHADVGSMAPSFKPSSSGGTSLFGDFNNALPKTGVAAMAKAKDGIVAKVDHGLQQEALCELAQQHLRRHWQNKRPQLETYFRKMLDPAYRESTVQEGLAIAANILGDDGPRMQKFGAQMRKQVEAFYDEIGPELRKPTPDYEAIAAHYRRQLVQEDALVQALYGSQMLERYRLAELDERTAALAILATFVDADWATSVVW